MCVFDDFLLCAQPRAARATRAARENITPNSYDYEGKCQKYQAKSF